MEFRIYYKELVLDLQHHFGLPDLRRLLLLFVFDPVHNTDDLGKIEGIAAKLLVEQQRLATIY